MSDTILITGGAGMIGSNLAHALLGVGYDVWVVDNLWRGRLDNLMAPNRFSDRLKDRFLQIDLRVPGELNKLPVKPDIIFHLADIVAGIDYVFSHQSQLFRDNILINSNVITSARDFGLNRFVYVGTACSFPQHLQSGPEAPPLKEKDQYPANPESAYGWSKLMGEYETFLFEKETNVPCSVLVLHNVYGAPCDFGKRSQVIPALIRKAVRYPEEEFVVWGSGKQGRAFVHVNDVTAALMLALDNGWGCGPIQIGTETCTSIREIAEMIVRVSGKDIRIRFDESKPEGDKGRRADITKAKDLLGWAPQVTMEQGLRKVYQWVEEQLES